MNNSKNNDCYAAIDLVIRKDEHGKYHATGGPSEALFCGTGNSSDEAIGSWFRQNRESVNFTVSFIADGEFQCSTRYGVGRAEEELGPNELKALKEFKRNSPTGYLYIGGVRALPTPPETNPTEKARGE